MKRLALACLAAAALVQPLAAQEQPTPKDLPTTTQAAAWIDKDPLVVEAGCALAATGHGAAARAAGSYEWTARASAQRRNVRDAGNSNEWSAQLERGVRIGGKAALDRQIGDADLVIARARIGMARHEVARDLADLWLGWLAATRTQDLLKEQVSFAEANAAAVEKRKRAGDASVLDLNVAQADLTEERRQASQVETNAAKARAKLRLRFVDAPRHMPTEPVPLADPADPMWTEVQWRERILAEAAVLRLAAAQVRKAELSASRANADKLPDPTLGVFTSSESFRTERVVGISISMPLSGTYRHELMRQSLQSH